MTQPIRPGEVPARKLELLPEGVIKAFNELITKHWDGERATFFWKDAVQALLVHEVTGESKEHLDRYLPDVKFVYQDSGWRITYDKSSYADPGGCLIVFTPSEDRERG